MLRAIGLTCAVAAICWAQPAARPASITAVGSASISEPPDLARVDVGVYTQAVLLKRLPRLTPRWLTR